MDINELRKLSEDNKSKVRVYGKDSYIRFIKGKMAKRAQDGRTEVSCVFDNLNIPLPTKEVLDEIVEAFQDEGFRVLRNQLGHITKISWQTYE